MKAALQRAYMSAPVVFLGLLSAMHCRSTSPCRCSLPQDTPQRESGSIRVKVQSLLQTQHAKVKYMTESHPWAITGTATTRSCVRVCVATRQTTHILLAVANRSRCASLCPAPCTHFLVIACRIFTLGPTSSLTGKYTRRSNLIRENHQRTWRSMTGA